MHPLKPQTTKIIMNFDFESLRDIYFFSHVPSGHSTSDSKQ